MIGKKIKERRQELKMNLRELGEQIGLSASFLSQVENDRTSPSLSTLHDLAAALRTSMAYLVVEDDPSIAKGLVKNLSFEGYRTLLATDGEQGLTLEVSGPWPPYNFCPSLGEDQDEALGVLCSV